MNTQYQLCFYSGSLTGKVFPITKEETKIGRDSSCDIVLTENSVSRIHVFLYVQQNGAVVLVDNNSTNGTIVNNIQISAPVQLSENDVIGLGGDVMLVFQKVAGFDAGSQWSGSAIPAGNAPDSYNFEKKQGNPMSNDNNNFPNNGAMNGFAANAGQIPPQGTDNYGFNQAYNYGMPPVNQGQIPYGYNQPGTFGQFDANGMNTANPMQSNSVPAPADGFSAQAASSTDAVSQAPAENNSEQSVSVGANPISQQQTPNGNELQNAQPSFAEQSQSYSQQGGMGQQMPYGQQPFVGQPVAYGQGQIGLGNNPYSQQMGQQSQIGIGNDPYSQQMMGQQPPMGYGNNPYPQQMMGQQPQMGYGNDPSSQQMIGQQPPMGYGNDPYGQHMMGQHSQMGYGNDPYSQQMMGQQPPMGYGNDPYSQQMMGQQPPMGYGNDSYGQQMMGQQPPMGYGNDPYGQQMMGQQPPMGYGNTPYGQQQMPYGNNPFAQQQNMEQQNQNQPVEKSGKKKSNKKLFITLGIVLLVLILISAFIFYVDHNRLWCDVFPFLWDADTCANYVR